MNDPLGVKNCHCLDVIDDDIGPHGISIDPNKVFDDEAQWKYLEGLLQNKVDLDIASKIKSAHSRLPELFRQIHTDTKVTYPFKYDCVTGEYLYPDLERNLRKNVLQCSSKA